LKPGNVAVLFKFKIQEKEAEFMARIHAAGNFVFGNRGEREQILLSDNLLDQYSLGSVHKGKIKPNSHLSLLAMMDCWHQHMRFVGKLEYLFLNHLSRMQIQAALYAKEIREDDMELRDVGSWMARV
ncbi:prephenate dehydrogenase (NADP(+)), partial [Modicella reniformis]